MTELSVHKKNLLYLADQLQKKYELSKTVGDDYYNPGMMENLDQYMGIYSSENNSLTIRTESKGLRYENRTPKLEKQNVGDEIHLVRDPENLFNSNNFRIMNSRGDDLGNLSAEICNELAPLYDMGYAVIDHAEITYIESIFQRSRYAKSGVMFVEITIRFRGV